MPANVGNQTVSVQFHATANSGVWNKRQMNVRQVGIYTGGWLAVVNGTTASLSALACEITDGIYQIRGATADLVNISVTSSTPYVVLRWTYAGTINDYMEILAVATPGANDLIVGKCTFSGGGALNGFSYDERINPSTKDLFLKVEPTGDSELRVRIRGGYFQTATGSIKIPDQKSDTFTPPASNSRVYLVYVDTDGTVKIDSSGTIAVDPVAPSYYGKLVLAEVTVLSTDTAITVDMIKDVRPFLTNGRTAVDNLTIEISASGQLQLKAGGISHDKLGNVYDSGWFACAAGASYVKTHGLGGIALSVTLLFAPDSGGSPDLTRVTKVDSTSSILVLVQDITATQFTVVSALPWVAYRLVGGVVSGYASGHYRVLAMRVA